MNVMKSAVVGGATGAVLGGLAVVPLLSITVFLDVIRVSLAQSLAGRSDQTYTFNPEIVPHHLLLKAVLIGTVLGSLVAVVCAVVTNCFFSILGSGKKTSN